MLQEVLGIRPHLLVLNKMDLADPHQQSVSAGGREWAGTPQGFSRTILVSSCPHRESWSN